MDLVVFVIAGSLLWFVAGFGLAVLLGRTVRVAEDGSGPALEARRAVLGIRARMIAGRVLLVLGAFVLACLPSLFTGPM